jgi:hypothetical protein
MLALELERAAALALLTTTKETKVKEAAQARGEIDQSDAAARVSPDPSGLVAERALPGH